MPITLIKEIKELRLWKCQLDGPLFCPTLSAFSNFSVLLCPLFQNFLSYFVLIFRTFLSYFLKINYSHPRSSNVGNVIKNLNVPFCLTLCTPLSPYLRHLSSMSYQAGVQRANNIILNGKLSPVGKHVFFSLLRKIIFGKV